MENQEIDEWATDSIVDDEIVETGEEEKETTPNKKNKSNFNSLYKKTKELEKLLESRDEELATKTAELREWEELNPELEEDNKSRRFTWKMGTACFEE